MNTGRYSPIAPIHLLERLFYTDDSKGVPLLGNYLLLLAHDVLAHQLRYSQLIRDVRHAFGADTFIMMDNSVVELGHPMPTAEVIEAANIVNADCIMTPDVLGSAEDTKRIVARDKGLLVKSGIPLMRIPQGSTLDEIEKCIYWLSINVPPEDSSEFDYWGIPRWITNKFGSRTQVIDYINNTRRHPKIHLLGMSNSVEDDARCLRCMANVMGIDSANPVVLGLRNLDISKDAYSHLDRGDYWRAKVLTKQAIKNVEYMRIVCSGQ